MAFTYARPTTNEDSSFLPPYQLDLYDVTFDSAYPTGGLALGDGTTGIPNALVTGFQKIGGNAASAGYEIVYNTSTKKLIAYKNSAGAVTAYEGLGLKGATNPANTEYDVDKASAPVNSGLWMAADTFTNLGTTATITTQPDIARNVMITVYNSTGGALLLYNGDVTYTVTGTDINGVAQTEDIVWALGTRSIAASKYRYIQGVKAFASVSTVTWNHSAAGGLSLSVGPGPLMGLPVALATPAYTDVKSFMISETFAIPVNDGTALGGVNTTYNTINTGTTADTFDFNVIYNAVANEVSSGADLSGVTVRGFIIHRR